MMILMIIMIIHPNAKDTTILDQGHTREKNTLHQNINLDIHIMTMIENMNALIDIIDTIDTGDIIKIIVKEIVIIEIDGMMRMIQ